MNSHTSVSILHEFSLSFSGYVPRSRIYKVIE